MITKVAELLRSQIEDLPFVDLLGGLTKPLTLVTNTGEETINKVLPVDVNVLTNPCDQDEKNKYIPDTSKLSVIFFEDQGTTLDREDTYYRYLETTLRMMCWFNLPLINVDYIDSSLLVLNILETIPERIANTDELFIISVAYEGQASQQEDIFEAYDFNLPEHQYNIFPYDTAGLDFVVSYAVGRNCLGDLTLNPKVC